MITAFKAGTLVQNRKGSSKIIYTIGDCLKSYHWQIPGYLGGGFYEIVRDGGVKLVAHEDDLELVPEYNGA